MINQNKKILLTSGRSFSTLELARFFSNQGHEVYVTDCFRHFLCAYSNSVKKSFTTIQPRKSKTQFIEEILHIVKSEKIDFLIPTGEEIMYLSEVIDQFPSFCKVFTMPYSILEQLHNKWHFYLLLKNNGMLVPETTFIQSKKELKGLSADTQYALKPCYTRGSVDLHKWALGDPLPNIDVSQSTPWIAQEWIEGKQYCSYSICHNGEIRAHSNYPVVFSVNGYSCISFTSVNHSAIFEWVKEFVKKEKYTGQIAFDFIDSEKGIYAVDCNPRTTSGIHLFNNSHSIDRAFFNTSSELVMPTNGTHKQLLGGMLMYGWKSFRKGFFRSFFSSSDVIFSRKDPIPFILQFLLCMIYLYQSKKLKMSLSEFYVYDTAWNG